MPKKNFGITDIVCIRRDYRSKINQTSSTPKELAYINHKGIIKNIYETKRDYWALVHFDNNQIVWLPRNILEYFGSIKNEQIIEENLSPKEQYKQTFDNP